jgi:hypothetical protein
MRFLPLLYPRVELIQRAVAAIRAAALELA